ncbi:nicotinate-nucleotide--dimethylbenzimidazole phosphoribosyltransferase [Streptomyces sp. NPDC007088]|uniref:nicotinate-nucleotide--dimethylbenzimidazole phosphoribosyltransferase n=1 Tax=Streptomyces sp. NPDC007088 TaxID=3364773 RepID=UPI0036CB9B0A
MTDTGKVPAEGQPEGAAQQPGTYPYPGYGVAAPAEDDDLLFMPGAQGAWTEAQPVLPANAAYEAAQEQPEPQVDYAHVGADASQGTGHTYVPAAEGYAAPAPAPQATERQPWPEAAHTPVTEPVADPETPDGGQPSPEPLDVPAGEAPPSAEPAPEAVPAPEPEAAHLPGPHETDGRDSGAVDLSAVRNPAAARTPAQPVRRPLHMGPPLPDTSNSPVRSLADRGPAGAPNPVSAPQAVRTGGTGYVDTLAPAAPAAEAGTRPATGRGTVPAQGSAADPAPAGATGTVPEQDRAGVEPAGPAAEYGTAEPAEAVTEPEPASEPPAEPTAPEAPASEAAPSETPVAEAPTPETTAAVPVEEPPGAPAVTVEEPPAGEPAELPVPAVEEPVAAASEPLTVPGPAPEEAVSEEPAPAVAQELAPAQTESAAEPAAPVAEPAAPVAEPDAPVAEPVAPDVVPDASDAAPERAVTPPAPLPYLPGSPEEAQGPLGEFVAVDGPVPTGPQPATAVPPAETPVRSDVVEPPAETGPRAETETRTDAETGAPVEPSADPLADPLADRLAGPAEAVTTAPEVAPAPVPEAVWDPQEQATATPAQSTPVPEATPAPREAAPEAPAGPPAPGYGDAEREAVMRVMRERRDIRNGFRPDPVPHDVLLRVLEAAHTAPSVGHSQPWDFVVIRSEDTRRSMHELAERQREAYAASLPKGRAKQFRELKIEAILDTPVNIVVTADPTRGGRHTLGRHTQPQMAPYSSALAVENLWLAARAEGLGVGWVSFFDEREMVRALGLPEHLEVVAYLCLGYVDAFPEEPELMQSGWSKRRPLSWVVHEETYGRRALPGAAPADLLSETVAHIRPLDAKALGEAWERQKRMTKPAGALGMLEIISAQLSGLSRICPPPVPEPAAVAIFAGDHGVHAQGVTAWPQEVTAQMVANFLGGGAVCNAFATQVGAEVCVVDVGVAADLPASPGLLPRKVRAGTADMTTGPALTREEVKAAVEVGIETARDLVAAGNKALITGEMGIANTTASAALISVFTDADPAEVTGRGTGINDEMHAHKIDVIRRALDLHRPDPADPIGVLAAIGGLEHAAMAGLLLGGASLRTPVILDGVSAGAAALVARAIAPEVLAACIAGHRSAEPGHVAALNSLGLRPLVDLDLRLGEGTGALLALPLVQSAARAMHEVATFDSAGVTEK